MNIMKVTIGATFALLIASLFMSIKAMKNAEIRDPAALEIARLEKRQAQLEAAILKGTSNNRQTFTAQLNTPSVIKQAAAKQADLSELEKIRKELAELRKDRDEIEEKAAVIVEDDLASRPVKNDRRTSLIQSALVMARITEYDNINKIAGIEIERIGNVNTGDILGIRRNSGIIGRLTVGMIDRNQGVADPLPGTFMGGAVDIQLGDELILPPD